jgi:hypothetical protein
MKVTTLFKNVLFGETYRQWKHNLGIYCFKSHDLERCSLKNKRNSNQARALLGQSNMGKDGQTDRPTDRQTDRLTDRQTKRVIEALGLRLEIHCHSKTMPEKIHNSDAHLSLIYCIQTSQFKKGFFFNSAFANLEIRLNFRT